MSLKAILICLMALIVMVNGAVPSNCLGCICHASTGCNRNEQCHHSNSYFCGPFLISYNYWATAGRPLNTYTNADTRGAFEDCVLNLDCASKTINLFMEKEGKDCDGDGQLTCEDYVRIHKYGPNGCGQPLTGKFGELYYECANRLV
ncbi:lysozyme 2-like isoform X2 [Panulirus ornatus]|uniref:lysozyme 2-like isoform X1 n=1 Tax=Panulirus ornatus TaxID=150431 RepID=UPI003A8758EA